MPASTMQKCPKYPLIPKTTFFNHWSRRGNPAAASIAAVEHEGELVAVIGKRGRSIQPEDANEYILGYTIGNDVTARDLQRRDGQWIRSKGFDTFCPIGPWIETEFESPMR